MTRRTWQVSVIADTHRLLRRVLEGLRAGGAGDVGVVVGGIIPPRDVEPLKALGAAAVFPMGTPLPDVVEALAGMTRRREP